MKNIEQIRAAHALEFWETKGRQVGKNGGNIVSSLGSLILNDGLLATLSFCKAKGDGHETIAQAICKFVGMRIGLDTTETLESSINSLCRSDSTKLQLATEEAIRFLDYLKRFQPKS